MNVKSPYNFVPAPKESEVFKPEWSHQVSHDIPFSDGESGEIEIKIIAKTPIFIRNGHAKDVDETEFAHYVDTDGNKQYFIPGSSLKGMIRNVLEIMTRSRMSQVGNNRYAFRDLTSNSLYMKTYKSNNVQCGWLQQDINGNWKILDCGRPILIHHEEVDKILSNTYKSEYKIGDNTYEFHGFRKLFLNGDHKKWGKSAKWKYDLVNDSNKLTTRFTLYTVEDPKNPHASKTKARYDKNGSPGTIVFTGQSSKRKEPKGNQDFKPSGKVHEFVFFDPSEERRLNISEKMQKDFKFIYLDHDKNNISPDWKYWKSKLVKGGRIPVFYTPDGGGGVKHFGLAFMYKLPYKYSIHEMAPFKDYIFKEPDMVETIFGYIDDKRGSLKGRVMVGHAMSKNAKLDSQKKEILAGPKASYFPFYLEQPNPQNAYKTYQDNGGILRGFKRYPTQDSCREGTYDVKQSNNVKVFSKFKPVKAGATFVGKIRFHNLRKSEIGALLSALTFHNSEKVFHSFGGAKSFGYGVIKIEITSLKHLKCKKLEYLKDFELLMDQKCTGWRGPVNELLSMASIPDDDSRLTYMPLADFVKLKNENKFLRPHSNIFKKCIKKTPQLVSQDERIEIEYKKVDENSIEELEGFIDKYPSSHKAAEAKKLLKELKDKKVREEYNKVDKGDIESLEKFIRESSNSPFTNEAKELLEKLRNKKKEGKIKEAQKEKFETEGYTFDQIKKWPNEKKKVKGFSFTENQKQDIIEAIKECFNKETSDEGNRRNKFYKNGKLVKGNKFPWTDIKKWLGEEGAKKLYKELTGEKV